MDLERAFASAGVALFAVVAVASAIPACGGTESTSADAAMLDASVETQIDVTSPPDTGFDFESSDADTTFVTPPTPDAGPLPLYACGDAATDAPPPWEVAPGDATISDVCPLPPSHCLDNRWLVSYVNGVCEDGVCRYWRTLHDCGSVGGSRCQRDHCSFPLVK